MVPVRRGEGRERSVSDSVHSDNLWYFCACQNVKIPQVTTTYRKFELDLNL